MFIGLLVFVMMRTNTKAPIIMASFIRTALMNSLAAAGLVGAWIGVRLQVINPHRILHMTEHIFGKNKREPRKIPDDKRSKLRIKHRE